MEHVIESGTFHNASLRRFFVREDPIYEHYNSTYSAKGPAARAIYLSLYLLPGVVGYLLVNVGPIFELQLRLTGFSSRTLQFSWFLVIAFGWHIFAPFLMLRYTDKLSLPQISAFLGLNRVDWRGVFVVLPVYCAGFAVISAVYMTFVWNPLEHLLTSVPAFRIPSYSIFASNFYNVPPLLLFFLFIGNFFGEELYFRAYLMKKSAFLGRANWVVNSTLFSLYHLWQIPQTWPLVGLVLAFGLLMTLRKDLTVLVVFHLFVNLWLTYGEYPLAHVLGLR